MRDRFSAYSVEDASEADEVSDVDSELVELGNTTPLVSRFSTISSTTEGALLVNMTSADIDPLNNGQFGTHD